MLFFKALLCWWVLGAILTIALEIKWHRVGIAEPTIWKELTEEGRILWALLLMILFPLGAPLLALFNPKDFLKPLFRRSDE